MGKKVVLLILVTISTIISGQKYYNWEEKQLPEEVRQAVAFSADSVIIYTYDKKFYRTSDGGDSWGRLLDSLEQGTHVYLNKVDSSLFISIQTHSYEGKLFVTENFGSTYEEISTPSNNIYREIFRLSDLIVSIDYTDKELHYSSDGGYNWQYLTGLPHAYAEDFKVSEDGELYCHIGDSIQKYDIHSGQWIPIDVPGYISGYVISGDSILVTCNELYFSFDGGLNWNESDTLLQGGRFLTDDLGKSYIRFSSGGFFPPYHGILKVNFAPFALEQICSVPEITNVILFYNGGMIYFADNTMFVQQEELSPEFKTTYFPLAEGNEWFYTEASGQYGFPNNEFYLKEYVAEIDTIIDGKTFMFGPPGNYHTSYYFNSDENRIYTYNSNSGIEVGLAFNYKDYYLQPISGDGSGKVYLFPMNDVTFSNSDEELTLKYIHQEYLISESHFYIGFLENFGLLIEDSDDIFGGYFTRHLRQARIYTEPGEFIKFDSVEDPEIEFDFPQLLQDIYLEFDFDVKHDFSRSGTSGDLNFVKNLSLVYFYDDAGTTTNKDTILIPADSIGYRFSHYNYQFQLDTTKVGVHGRFLKYKFIAETKGIYPHYDVSPAEGWHQIEYIPLSLNGEEALTDYSLSQNYPNPFNPSTKMEFTLPKECEVEIAVFNVTGEKLFTVTNDIYRSGRHFVTINMADYSSGVYFVSLISESQRLNRKIILVK